MKYNSLYRGIVEDNNDPKNLGRCRVRVPSIHGSLTYPVNLLPWARPVVTSAVSKGRGSVNIPELKDVVWVMFEGSDNEYPVYIGGSYAVNELPIDKNKVILYTEEDMRFVYDRETGDTTLETNDSSIVVKKDKRIVITSEKIDLEGYVCVNGVCPAPETKVLELEQKIESSTSAAKIVRW